MTTTTTRVLLRQCQRRTWNQRRPYHHGGAGTATATAARSSGKHYFNGRLHLQQPQKRSQNAIQQRSLFWQASGNRSASSCMSMNTFTSTSTPTPTQIRSLHHDSAPSGMQQQQQQQRRRSKIDEEQYLRAIPVEEWLEQNDKASSSLSSKISSVWEDWKVGAFAASNQNDNNNNHIDRYNSNFNSSLSSPWWWAKIPKGFENFFPKDKDGNVSTNNTESKTSKNKNKHKKQQRNNSFQSKNKNSKNKKKGGIPPPEDQDPHNIPALIAMLLMVMAARRYLGDEDDSLSNDGTEDGSRRSTTTKNGKEITFVDFRNQLLESGQVEKIVVVNNSLARVILHPGAKGIPAHLITGNRSMAAGAGNHSGTGTSNNNTSSSSNTLSRNGRAGAGGGHQEDTTTMQFDGSYDADANSANMRMANDRALAASTPSYHFYIGSIESFEEKLSKAQGDIHPREWIPVQYVNEINLMSEFIKATPMLAMLGILYYYSRGMMGGMGAGGAGGSAGGGMGGIFQVGKSNAKKIKPEEVQADFSDVAGCQQAKREVMEFVDFLKDSSRFTKLGAKIPKGALLCGPPGTGKTLLAKAVAGEAGVPFFSISGSDFIEMFVGVGPSRVRDLFKEARASAPCIIFIDEIDAVGRQRGRGGFSGGNDERENTLNQLLVEMDGFTPSTGVVVLAGTNRVDILDQALTRPGRFDRQIQVDKPDLEGRKEIFNVHLSGITLKGSIEDIAGRLAGLTPGFAGADIANLCNEAAIVAARRKAESVTVEDFEKATDRIIGGLESNKIMSDHEKQIVAHHEAGHAVAGWFLEHADPLLKVTIIPRTSGALGFAQYLPKEISLRSQDQIMDIVCMALAGRAAEEVMFGRVTTGASDDLRRVTQMVYGTIQTYGMNSRVGQLAYPRDDGQPGDKPYSDATAEAMDDEARAIVDAAYQRTLDLIREKKEQVESVAQLLLEKETITHDDMIDLIGDRPFEGDKQYKEYISARHHRKGEEEEEKVNEEENGDDADAQIDRNDGGLTPGLA